jgi:hypothetical protein
MFAKPKFGLLNVRKVPIIWFLKWTKTVSHVGFTEFLLVFKFVE